MSDGSSDVCSSDRAGVPDRVQEGIARDVTLHIREGGDSDAADDVAFERDEVRLAGGVERRHGRLILLHKRDHAAPGKRTHLRAPDALDVAPQAFTPGARSYGGDVTHTWIHMASQRTPTTLEAR